jgi:hypothetical protein
MRGAVPRQVIGAGAHDVADGREAARDQAGVRQRGDADGEIEAFLHQVDLAVVEIEFEAHVGMPRS